MDEQLKLLHVRMARLENLLEAFIDKQGYNVEWENEYRPELVKKDNDE